MGSVPAVSYAVPISVIVADTCADIAAKSEVAPPGGSDIPSPSASDTLIVSVTTLSKTVLVAT